MPRIRPYIAAVAVLSSLSLGFVPVAAVSAWGAPLGGVAAGNPALNSQVQEALAKAQAQKAIGGTPTGGVGTEAGSGGAFSKLTEKGGEEEATTSTARKSGSSSSSSGPLSAGVLLPLLLVGGGLLVAIAFLILRDARGVTPAGDLLAATGSAQARAARLRKRRAKAKAARQQRKRNR